MIDKIFITKYSQRYQYNYLDKNSKLEEEIRAVMRRKPAYITRDLLYKIVNWKAPRIRGRVKLNREDLVKEVTRNSFASKNEQFRVEVLTLLKGVKYRAATTILHFRFPRRYTIMDYRAWESLQDARLTRGERDGFKIDKCYKIKDDFEHWMTYLTVCRNICKREGCSLRDLDKALWQYSKEK